MHSRFSILIYSLSSPNIRQVCKAVIESYGNVTIFDLIYVSRCSDIVSLSLLSSDNVTLCSHINGSIVGPLLLQNMYSELRTQNSDIFI